LFIADAWDEIFKCQVERKADRAVKCARIERLSKTVVCPDGDCEPIEHGGLLVVGQQLVVSDEHQRRLLVRGLASDQSQKLESMGKTVLGRVHDAASIAPGTIVVAESAAGNDERVDDADRQKAPHHRGAVYTLSHTGVREDVKAEFEDPVGVAYSARDKRLYVADISPNAETWRYFDREPSGWTEKGILWTAPIKSPTERPRLQSIVIGVDRERSSEIIFAAGPDGLYLLDPAGVLLAKYMLSAPVSGLTWGDGGELFMTVGRRLCVLMTAARPADPPTEKWPPQ
jgi:sugar lactone lactonase YvrE